MDAFDNDSITWGRAAKSLYKGNNAYLSFFYGGEEYELYENFYLHDESASEPHIGKVVALWEDKKTERKRMLLRWFFRPADLVLLGLDPNSKELFLAFGEGKGVMNDNDLEVILQKCQVLCTSKDSQNIQPSENDIRNADYYFYRIYDVNRKCIYGVDKVAKKLGFDVVFNKQTWVSGGMERPLVSKDIDITNITEVKKEANAISAMASMLVCKEGDGPHQPDSSKDSEENKNSKPVSNGISDVQGGFLSSNEEKDRNPSHKMQQGSKKRARESEMVPGVPKKRLDAEVTYTKKVNDSSGIKRPKKEGSEDGNEKKKLKVTEETKISTAIKDTSAAPGTSPDLPDALTSTVKLNEDLQTEKMSTLHSLEIKDNPIVIEDTQDLKEVAPISGMPDKLSDASGTAIKLKEDIQGEGKNNSQFLVTEHFGAGKEIKPKEEEVQGEQESKSLSLETEKLSRPGDITLKSPVTSSKTDVITAKPSKVTEDGEHAADVEKERKQVSAGPDPLLARVQKEKDSVSKKVASQEGKPGDITLKSSVTSSKADTITAKPSKVTEDGEHVSVIENECKQVLAGPDLLLARVQKEKDNASKKVASQEGKPGDITLKSPVTSSKVDAISAKPSKVTEDGEHVADVENERKQVSAGPDPLLARVQKEKDNASKKVASQEGKPGNITLKSPVTSSKADVITAKPSKVTEDGEHVADVENEHKQVSAGPDPLLARVQKEKDNVSKKVASQEGKAMQKPLSKVAKSISNSREEGGTGGKGENRKVVEMRKVSHVSSHKKEEIENKRVDYKAKAIGTKLVKTSKATTNNVDGKELKDLERFTSETAVAKKMKSGEQVKLSEKSESLKGKEEARVQPKSAFSASGNVRSDINLEKRSIFKQLPWEENILQGLPQRRVLLVSNFSPSFTSLDVCDMLKSVFKGCSDARLLSQSTTCPYGKALVIFHNRGFAESAMQEMEEKCLVLTDSNRPLIASVAEPPESSKVSRFPGHFPVEKFKMSRQHDNEEMRKAVSTSHCSQPNTIEFEMAMEWRQQQEIAQKCWDDLFKRQDDEVDVVLRKRNQQKPMNVRF